MSLGTLGRVAIEFGANLAGFENDMGRANRIAAKESAKMRDSIQAAVKVVAATAATAAGLAATAVKAAINRAAELDDIAQKVGAGVRELSQIQFGAQLEGVDDFSGSLTKLSKAVIEAKDQNSQAAKAFRALGVETLDASGKVRATDQILLDVAQSFSAAADGADKSAIAQELFGKSGSNLIPFLNKGREGLDEYARLADKLGITISSKTAAAADEFNDQLFIAGSALTGVANRVAEALLPALTDLTTKFVGYTTETGSSEKVTTALTDAVQGLAIGAAVVGETVYGLAKGVRALGGSFEAVFADVKLAAEFLGRGGVLGLAFESNREALKKALDERNKTFEEASQRYVDLWNYDGTAVSDAIRESFKKQGAAIQKVEETEKPKLPELVFGGKDPQADLDKAVSKATARLQDLDAELRMQLATFDAGEAAAIAYRLSLGDLAPDVAALGAVGLTLADSIIAQTSALEGQNAVLAANNKLKQEAEQFAKAVIQRGSTVDTKQMEEAIRRAGEQGGIGSFGKVQNGIADAKDAEAGRFEAERKRLQDDLNNRLIDQQTYHEAVEAAEREHQSRMAEIESAGQEAKKSLYQNAFDAIGDLGSDFQASVLAQSKKGFEISKAISIAQATVKTYDAAISAYNALVGIPIVGPALAVGAAGAAVAFGLAQVAAINATQFQGRRFGGPVKAGGLYEILEGGDPELIKTGNRTLLAMGDASGYVTPARVARDTVAPGGGGGRDIKIEVSNAPAGTTAAVVEGISATTARIVLGGINLDFEEFGPMAQRLENSRIRRRGVPRS